MKKKQVAGEIAAASRRHREKIAEARRFALGLELGNDTDPRLVDVVEKVVELREGHCNRVTAEAVANAVWAWLAEGDTQHASENDSQ